MNATSRRHLKLSDGGKVASLNNTVYVLAKRMSVVVARRAERSNFGDIDLL